jgi:hypothetical protein
MVLLTMRASKPSPLLPFGLVGSAPEAGPLAAGAEEAEALLLGTTVVLYRAACCSSNTRSSRQTCQARIVSVGTQLNSSHVVFSTLAELARQVLLDIQDKQCHGQTNSARGNGAHAGGQPICVSGTPAGPILKKTCQKI